jgi:mitochondrial fission protein ELM1
VTEPDPNVIHEIYNLIMKGNHKTLSEGSKMIIITMNGITINVNETKK